MLALEGNFAYSFLLGIAAAVNPCGFVMLPAYLTYFLSSDDAEATDQRAGIRRALTVSAAVSAGFIVVFVVVGAITRLFTDWLEQQSKYAGLAIGVAMVVMGVAMLFGWKPPLNTAGIASGARRTRSLVSMFLYGVAYAVASIGCTIGLLVSTIFGSYDRLGYVSGVVSTALYGVGMAMLVTALTVTLAVAKHGLLRRLRSVMAHLQTASAVVITLTGAYLAWYWYRGIYRVGEPDRVTTAVEGWQAKLHTWLQERGASTLGVVLGGVVLIAVIFVAWRRSSPSEPPPPAPSERREHVATP